MKTKTLFDFPTDENYHERIKRRENRRGNQDAAPTKEIYFAERCKSGVGGTGRIIHKRGYGYNGAIEGQGIIIMGFENYVRLRCQKENVY